MARSCAIQGYIDIYRCGVRLASPKRVEKERREPKIREPVVSCGSRFSRRERESVTRRSSTKLVSVLCVRAGPCVFKSKIITFESCSLKFSSWSDRRGKFREDLILGSNEHERNNRRVRKIP